MVKNSANFYLPLAFLRPISNGRNKDSIRLQTAVSLSVRSPVGATSHLLIPVAHVVESKGRMRRHADDGHDHGMLRVQSPSPNFIWFFYTALRSLIAGVILETHHTLEARCHFLAFFGSTVIRKETTACGIDKTTILDDAMA